MRIKFVVNSMVMRIRWKLFQKVDISKLVHFGLFKDCNWGVPGAIELSSELGWVKHCDQVSWRSNKTCLT